MLAGPLLLCRCWGTCCFTEECTARRSGVAQSCVTLCDPRVCSLPVSSVHGVFQARVLEWIATSSPGDLPNPGTEPRSPILQAHALPSEPPGKPHTARDQAVPGRPCERSHCKPHKWAMCDAVPTQNPAPGLVPPQLLLGPLQGDHGCPLSQRTAPHQFCLGLPRGLRQ